MRKTLWNILTKYGAHIALVIFSAIFFIASQSFLDPDFGWHIKMGELILQSGIPATDPFSYTMPSYPFIDHEWLTNVLIALVYPKIGMIGLSVIFTLLGTGALFIAVPRKLKTFALVPIILSATILLGSFGVRPQIITIFFTAILLRIAASPKLWNKCRYLLPILFVVWSNLHGGFAIGIGLLVAVVFLKTLASIKLDYSDIFIVLLSIGGTFINPYCERIWFEIWNTGTDGALRWQIAEWLPKIFSFDLSFMLLLPLSGTLAFRYRKVLPLWLVIIFIASLIACISSQRHTLIWLLTALLTTSMSFKFLKEEAENSDGGTKKLLQAYKILVAVTIIAVLVQGYLSYKDSLFSGIYNYPDQAIGYLKTQEISRNIFSHYNWGGYLIWKYPDKKVFIDGRMPSWRNNTTSSSESKYAFKEFKTIEAAGYKDSFQKYNIQTVLWPKSKIPENNKDPHLIKKLQEDGWQKVYEDDIAVIYQSPN